MSQPQEGESPDHMRFRGKVVLVTGGASGIGAAAARRFASEGAQVVVADIDEDGARLLADDLPDGFAVTVDTADASSVEAAVRRAVDHYGRIDVVFNNAASPAHSNRCTNFPSRTGERSAASTVTACSTS